MFAERALKFSLSQFVSISPSQESFDKLMWDEKDPENSNEDFLQ